MRTGFCLAAIWLLLPTFARGETLPVVYPSRPPYNYTVDGKAAGTLVELVEKILEGAGLSPQFAEMPSKRILLGLKEPGSRLCSFGWFKNPERESYAVFTRPISEDSPLLALILQKNAPHFSGKATFKELAADKALPLGLITGWSYGDTIDGLIRQEQTPVVDIPGRREQGAMLAMGRFAYTLARESEIDEVISLSGRPAEEFLALSLADVQERNKRYILCGKGVPEAVIARINASIQACCAVPE